MSFSIDWTKGLRDASETLRTGAKEFLDLAKSTKDKDKQFLYRRLGGMCSFMSSLFLLGVNNREDIEVLFQTINKFPEEFDKIKNEMETERKKIKDTLQPIKDSIEDAKKSSERGKKVYG